MVFTQEDAQDDAKIKREVKSDLGRIARNKSNKIYQHFENVCAQMNQNPNDVLADMLVRALNNQDYADTIADTEITMEAISKGDYRKEDIKMVKEIAEEFGLEPDEDKKSPVDKIIESRIEAVSSGPLDRFDREGDQKRSDMEKQKLEREIGQLENEIQSLKREMSNDQETQTKEVEKKEKSGDRKDMDELFGGDGEEGEEEVVEVEREPEDEEEDEGGDISIDVTNSMGDEEEEDE